MAIVWYASKMLSIGISFNMIGAANIILQIGTSIALCIWQTGKSQGKRSNIAMNMQ